MRGGSLSDKAYPLLKHSLHPH